MKIVVVGGTGLLGSLTVKALAGVEGVSVAALSRSGASPAPDVVGVQAELLAGDRIDGAIAGADAIVWCAHDRQAHANDAAAMRNLIGACMRRGVRHLVYAGIIGIETSLDSSYYAGKLAEERAIETSGVGHTILRAAQFHSLVETVLEACDEGDRLRVPHPLLLRPVAPETVAARLAEIVRGEPCGRAMDLAGPEDRHLIDFAAIYQRVKGLGKPLEQTAEAPSRWRMLQTLTHGPADRSGPDFETWLARRHRIARR